MAWGFSCLPTESIDHAHRAGEPSGLQYDEDEFVGLIADGAVLQLGAGRHEPSHWGNTPTHCLHRIE